MISLSNSEARLPEWPQRINGAVSAIRNTMTSGPDLITDHRWAPCGACSVAHPCAHVSVSFKEKGKNRHLKEQFSILQFLFIISKMWRSLL